MCRLNSGWGYVHSQCRCDFAKLTLSTRIWVCHILVKASRWTSRIGSPVECLIPIQRRWFLFECIFTNAKDKFALPQSRYEGGRTWPEQGTTRRDSRSYGQEGLGIKREGIWEIIKGKSLEEEKKIRQRENILSSMQIRMQLRMCSEKSKGLPNGKSEISHRKETIQQYFSYENTKRYPW